MKNIGLLTNRFPLFVDDAMEIYKQMLFGPSPNLALLHIASCLEPVPRSSDHQTSNFQVIVSSYRESWAFVDDYSWVVLLSDLSVYGHKMLAKRTMSRLPLILSHLNSNRYRKFYLLIPRLLMTSSAEMEISNFGMLHLSI